MKVKLSIAALVLAATCLYAADEKNVTLEGTLVSSSCYTGGPDHPMGNDMGGKKGCGSFCLRHGDPAGLVTKSKEFHVLIVSSLKLAPYVGQQVRITGEEFNGSIAVRKAEVAEGDNWKEVNLRSNNQ